MLFDGTWNKREDTTNVWRFKILLESNAHQVIYYDEGVGTKQGEEIVGGAFGQGLSAKVLEGYLWLMENFHDNDEIFIFGFSRGATTARSLVGFLAISGLLRIDSNQRIIDAYKFSRTPNIRNEHHHLAKKYRSKYSKDVRIKFLGIWDTVAALGIPKLKCSHITKYIPDIKIPYLEDIEFHKIENLPSIVDHARQALAIDEHRAIFEPILWPYSSKSTETMEQRWFAGSHANIGGGYERDGLFLRPLEWMQEEASKFGLIFTAKINSRCNSFYTSRIRDSLSETLGGLYFLSQFMKVFHRKVMQSERTNESIDYTVLERWIWLPSYRPMSLNHLFQGKPTQKPKSFHLEDGGDILKFILNWNQNVKVFNKGYLFNLKEEKQMNGLTEQNTSNGESYTEEEINPTSLKIIELYQVQGQLCDRVWAYFSLYSTIIILIGLLAAAFPDVAKNIGRLKWIPFASYIILAVLNHIALSLNLEELIILRKLAENHSRIEFKGNSKTRILWAHMLFGLVSVITYIFGWGNFFSLT